jgi:DNA-directed RNA polymerase specialized sigma24 family protein
METMANKGSAGFEPDYEQIRKEMVHLFIIEGVPLQDIEDLAQQVCTEVIERYDPDREINPQAPGQALAYKISYKVYAKYINVRKKNIVQLGNIGGFEPFEKAEHLDPAKQTERNEEFELVTKWIDEWFKTLTPWQQTVWELRFVYDLDVVTIGFLIRGNRDLTHEQMEELVAAHHGAGYRAITPLFISFVEYIASKLLRH